MKLIREYRMASDGIQAAGAIVLINKGEKGQDDYVTWFRNDDDSERMGRPAYSTGHYHGERYADAVQDFHERCKRYDPTGELHKEAMRAAA